MSNPVESGSRPHHDFQKIHQKSEYEGETISSLKRILNCALGLEKKERSPEFGYNVQLIVNIIDEKRKNGNLFHRIAVCIKKILGIGVTAKYEKMQVKITHDTLSPQHAREVTIDGERHSWVGLTIRNGEKLIPIGDGIMTFNTGGKAFLTYNVNGEILNNPVKLNLSSGHTWVGNITPNGEPEGKGQYFFKNGNSLECTVTNRRMTERDKFLTFKNNNQWTGEFSNDGEPLGEGTLTFPNGNVREGRVGVAGLPMGEGILTFKNGNKWVGSTSVDGKPQGRGTLTFKNGNKWVGSTSVDGTPQGQGRLTIGETGKVWLGQANPEGQPMLKGRMAS